MYIKKQIAFLWQKALNYFSKGQQRSIEAKKNIAATFLIKILSIAISLVVVPLTIGYINASQYGIWLALSSIIAWISFFDIGFTHGLRNKFAAAKANGDTQLAKIYVSTAYYYIAAIFILLWLILIIVNQFINWYSVLSIPASMQYEVSTLAAIVLSYFCFQFIFKIIVTILIADQKPAIGSLIDLLGQLFSLIAIFCLTKLTKGTLIHLGLASCIAPAAVLIISNYFFFKTKYKLYKPSIKFVKKQYAKDLLTLGVKFFVLQIASIIQFESILFLIAHYISTEQVTAYNIAYKYFFTLQMGFMILLTPLWTGVTDAYSKGDTEWIKKVVKKYLLVLIPFVMLGLIMLALSNMVYGLWLGKNVIPISFNVSLLCLIFFCTGMFASIFIAVINGLGALKLQIITAVITSVLFFGFCFLFVKRYNLGIESILIASIIANISGYIIAPLQFYKIFISKTSAKIWYK
jgi:O-antigen/teichoic acid export membrane protein